MRFYYISLFSLILLGLIYVFGTIFLVWLGKKLKKRWDGAWKVMVPLFLLLYIGPVAEELWIAWNFGQLCKKDAGIFIHRTVEVDGFYDDTHAWRADKLEQSGFTWVEGRDTTKHEPVYWRHERVGEEIRSQRIEKPTARFHYRRDKFGDEVTHKVSRQEAQVMDTSSGEIIAEYRVYSRRDPWFFIGLDRPGMGCDGADGGPRSTHKNSFLIYRDALRPAK